MCIHQYLLRIKMMNCPKCLNPHRMQILKLYFISIMLMQFVILPCKQGKGFHFSFLFDSVYNKVTYIYKGNITQLMTNTMNSQKRNAKQFVKNETWLLSWILFEFHFKGLKDIKKLFTSFQTDDNGIWYIKVFWFVEKYIT